jgi:RNA polymerase sigma-70 factor (ECF subfamily)
VKPIDPVEDADGPLIALATAGDPRAFETLYRRYVGRIHGLCLRMTRLPDRAEDCTQQTFINAWRSLPGFQMRSSFGTWLHRIAVNVVLAQRPHHFDAVLNTDAPETDGVFDTPVEVNVIEAAVASLPDGARNVLVLSGIYGYSHQETATMLGIAEGTCKAQLHRARQLLRRKLGMEESR